MNKDMKGRRALPRGDMNVHCHWVRSCWSCAEQTLLMTRLLLLLLLRRQLLRLLLRQWWRVRLLGGMCVMLKVLLLPR